MRRYIAIEGPIGVGKTTLTSMLEDRIGAEVVLDVRDNPFLAEFYREGPAAAFKTQMYFLASRFEQQMALAQGAHSRQTLVTDYLFARDKIFAYLNLDDQEILVYDRFFASLSRYVPIPDLVVYLKAPLEVLLERIKKRSVDYEAEISDSYVEELIKAYDHFFYHYTESPLLIVNTAEIDFVANEEDLRALVQRIAGGSVRGVEYYHPIRRKRS
ncbi:MAG: deoxynucleoside kinase [Acidobacteria bacterium]|nr:deoxynucleoside kinase [Acidobacteriota bacterium]